MKIDQNEINDAIKIIAKARAAGRPIIPLLGAGLSWESGVPTIYDLIRYFAYLRAYVGEKAYLPKGLRNKEGHPLHGRSERYKESLYDYIRDFDWPSPNELIDGLWRWRSDVEDKASEDKTWDLDTEAIRQLDQFAMDIHPGRYQALPENGPLLVGRSWKWDAVAEWTDLVRHVTGFKDDLASRLFSRLEQGRGPSLGHRYLAFLARLCSIKLFLSVSLDDLLEQALWDEGVPHRRYLVGDRHHLPDATLVNRSVAVLKLFGDASQPALGEQYETPLDEEFWTWLKNAQPDPWPLLLVIGCSGRGQRVIDLVRRTLRLRGDGVRVLWLHYEKDRPQTVLALQEHHPGKLDAACVNSPGLFLRHLYSSLTSRYHAAIQPYDALECRPTPLTFEPPLIDGDRDEHSAAAGIKEYCNEAKSLVLLCNLRKVIYEDRTLRPNEEVAPTAVTASERLIEWLNEQQQVGFIPISVDLEGQYTLPGVVGAIIDQCRLHDPDIAPSVLPLYEKGQATPDLIQRQIETAARRLGEALQRARYAIALDGLEMLPWPQTSHHGITSGEEEVKRTRDLLHQFVDLIAELANKHSMALRSSHLAMSVNWSSGRHNDRQEDQIRNVVTECLGKPVEQAVKAEGLLGRCELRYTRTLLDSLPEGHNDIILKLEEGDIWIRAAERLTHPSTGTLNKHADLMLLVISCFRRTRSLVALRSILGPLTLEQSASSADLGPYEQVDDLLSDFVKAGYLVPLEGGQYWMKRPLRDRIYSENSRATTTEKVCAFMMPELRSQKPECTKLTLQQLVVLALHHDRLARFYYAETFTQSKDSSAFFEYVYHRVSSIRYLTKLTLVLEAIWRGDDTATDKMDYATVPTLVQEACSMLAEQLPKASDYLQCGRDSDDWLADGAKLLQTVRKRRLQDIKSLRVAWEAAADILQTRVPAEHLISWYRWLLNDDLPRFRTEYYAGKERVSPEWLQICRRIDEEILSSWRDLRGALYDLWARSSRERGDPSGLVRQCAGYLDALGKDLERLVERSKNALPAAVNTCKELLEAASKVLDAVGRSKDLAEQQVDWENLTAPVLAPFKAESYSDGLNDWRVFFRSLRIGLVNFAEGLVSLGRARKQPELATALLDAVVKHITPGTSASLRSRELRAEKVLQGATSAKLWQTLKKIAEDGLLEVRQIDFIELHAIERFPYFRYWSHFLQYRARAIWSLAKDEPAPEREFKLAYRDLEMARGRSEMTPSRTAQARIDLAAAECSLEHAQWFLNQNRDPGANKAIAKLSVAASYLSRALSHLQHGRRNVIWWREYFRLLAIHKARRNRCRLIRLLFHAPDEMSPEDISVHAIGRLQGITWRRVERSLAKFVRALRQGLFAVGQVLDLTLDADEDAIIEVRNSLVKDALRMGAVALANDREFIGPETSQPEAKLLRGLDAVNMYVKDLANRADALPDETNWPELSFLANVPPARPAH